MITYRLQLNEGSEMCNEDVKEEFFWVRSFSIPTQNDKLGK